MRSPRSAGQDARVAAAEPQHLLQRVRAQQVPHFLPGGRRRMVMRALACGGSADAPRGEHLHRPEHLHRTARSRPAAERTAGRNMYGVVA